MTEPKAKKQRVPKLGGQRHKVATGCEVCGRQCFYKYYNVQSCEACKQFFRRAVQNRLEYACAKFDRCDIRKVKCRSCRLSQCLFAGMDPTLVGVQRSPQAELYLAGLVERRRRAIERNAQNGPPTGVDPYPPYRLQVGSLVRAKAEREPSPSPPEVCTKRSGGEEGQCAAAEAEEFPPVEEPTSGGTWSLSACTFQQIPGHLHDELQLALGHTFGEFSRVERRVRQFLGEERIVNEGFLEQFRSLRDLLQFGTVITICGSVDKYSQVAPPTSLQQKIEFIRKEHGSNACFVRKPNSLLQNLLSAVDLARTMPFFGELSADDQVLLVNFVVVPLMELFSKYYSLLLHSDIVISPSSRLSPLLVFKHSNRYIGDRAVHTLAELLFRQLMSPFEWVRLTEHEFLLLRALITANPHVPGLSSEAHQLLGKYSAKYAMLLKRHLEVTCSDERAACFRYEQMLQLASGVFFSAERHREFFTYLAMVADQGFFHASIPRAFIPMCLHGVE